MNEDELKDLWKTVDTKDSPTIDFDEVESNINRWDDKLRRKIGIEFMLCILMFLALIPFHYFFPELLYYLPFLVIMSAWYYWELWTIYREKVEFNDSKSTKEFLEDKANKLTRFVKITRLLMYSISPFIAFSSLFFNMTFEKIKEAWLAILILLVVIEIFVIALCEIYFRIMYIPAIKKSKELLEQLETEN